MMKKMSAVLALLMLLSFSGVGAEEITVKVSGDRNAVVQFTGTESADPDASGSVKASADFKAGKSAIDGEITVKNSPETQDANVSFYTSASGTSLEAIGFLDAKVPPSPDAPKKFTVNVAVFRKPCNHLSCNSRSSVILRPGPGLLTQRAKVLSAVAPQRPNN